MNFYLIWLTTLAILLGIGFIYSVYLLARETKKNQRLEYALMESNKSKKLLIDAMTELGYYTEIKARARQILRDFADNYQGGNDDNNIINI